MPPMTPATAASEKSPASSRRGLAEDRRRRAGLGRAEASVDLLEGGGRVGHAGAVTDRHRFDRITGAALLLTGADRQDSAGASPVATIV